VFWWMQVAIPVVPTVRVVITFTKSVEQFYTPLSSPRLFCGHEGSRVGSSDESDKHYPSLSSSSSTSSTTWLQRNSSQSASKQHRHSSSVWGQQQLQSDPFAIPSGYTWTSVDEKSTKMKKSKSTRKSK
jgi:hypothetical protein